MANLVIATGRLTRKEIKVFGSGGKVANLTVSIDNKKKDASGQWVSEPMPVEFSAFNNQSDPLADRCERYLQEGMHISLEGSLKVNHWQGQNGKQNSRVVINANKIEVIGATQPLPSAVPANSQPPATQQSLFQQPPGNDPPPF